MPGGGRLRIVLFTRSTWYDAVFGPDGNRTYDVTLARINLFIGGGPEGVVYVAADNAGFDRDSTLASEWSLGHVAAYKINGNGDLIVVTRRIFISGLSCAQGAVIDPFSGVFVFSRYAGDDRGVVIVKSFTPPA